MASAPETLSCRICNQNGAIVTVGRNADPSSQRPHHGLSDAGRPVVPTETRQVKAALKAILIKTDQPDAEGPARLLHPGSLRPAHPHIAAPSSGGTISGHSPRLSASQAELRVLQIHAHPVRQHGIFLR